ncbi:hypothetical protein BKK51_11095 [Rodentibacter trehalosifermentans]|uniref:Uncharacterized protein n=1 Tax=Rodentibacter trehalosifermentans TaxID=1908263 RepID=A0A1V3J3R9_9PAST|nr:hypothetical protein BKK51_11095 [Rodentibacter trehalosifermentans]OOF49755.1 hypothetical protein BKK52_02780 [Rodentibacter trehalosifermentans]OOF51637.1 hypothetical protein BKK53_07040 [Rodentibacter trehalosifermentans]
MGADSSQKLRQNYSQIADVICSLLLLAFSEQWSRWQCQRSKNIVFCDRTFRCESVNLLYNPSLFLM